VSKIANGFVVSVMNALEQAVSVSAEHINGFDDKTSVVVLQSKVRPVGHDVE
jgi:hypothetical protein